MRIAPSEGMHNVAAIESALDGVARTQDLVLDVDDVDLPATLLVPDRTWGLVIIAHGEGWCCDSPRTLAVAQTLQHAGIASLRLDLLARGEAADAHMLFDVEVLGRRLLAVGRWAAQEALPRPAPLGYFGATTGAPAAVIAAAQAPALVSALAVHGNRVKLADRWLPRVHAPTLFLVGDRVTRIARLATDWFSDCFCVRARAKAHPV